MTTRSLSLKKDVLSQLSAEELAALHGGDVFPTGTALVVCLCILRDTMITCLC